jgi:hypothetical protein
MSYSSLQPKARNMLPERLAPYRLQPFGNSEVTISTPCATVLMPQGKLRRMSRTGKLRIVFRFKTRYDLLNPLRPFDKVLGEVMLIVGR